MRRFDFIFLLSLVLGVSSSLFYYHYLGVKTTASMQEIRRAYRKLAKQYHPDKNMGNKKESERKMRIINEAYEYLRKRKAAQRKASDGNHRSAEDIPEDDPGAEPNEQEQDNSNDDSTDSNEENTSDDETTGGSEYRNTREDIHFDLYDLFQGTFDMFMFFLVYVVLVCIYLGLQFLFGGESASAAPAEPTMGQRNAKLVFDAVEEVCEQVPKEEAVELGFVSTAEGRRSMRLKTKKLMKLERD